MYDVQSEPREFVGATREEAVAKASQFFGAPAEALSVVEVEPAQVSGLAARILIVAFPEGRKPAARPERPSRGAAAPVAERGGRRGRGERGPRRAEREAAPPEPEAPAEPSEGLAVGELSEVGAFVLGVMERLGLGPFEVEENAEGEHLIVLLRGRAATRLTSGEGRAVDALQLLANQVSARLDDQSPRVILDVEGDREKRSSLLERAAERAAARARSSGRAVALDPMNGRDRRAVHVALRDVEGVATMSVGEGRYRQVVVVPEGAPEYEEALRQEGASEREGEG